MESQSNGDGSALADVVSIEEYVRTRSHIFPGEPSFRWFLRLHRARFLESGAVLQVTGRNYLRPEIVDNLVVHIGMESARTSLKGKKRWPDGTEVDDADM